MSYQPPLPPGSNPGPYVPHGQPPQGGPYAQGAYPAYVGYPSPAAQSTGLNPWIAGLVGVLIGGAGAMMLSFLVPMLFFGLAMGVTGGEFDDSGMMDGPPTRVSVAPDGSVPGPVLATALTGNGWYEGMTCPDTTKVATDVTTICRGRDGSEGIRVVVVFRGADGRFDTADLYDEESF